MLNSAHLHRRTLKQLSLTPFVAIVLNNMAETSLEPPAGGRYLQLPPIGTLDAGIHQLCRLSLATSFAADAVVCFLAFVLLENHV